MLVHLPIAPMLLRSSMIVHSMHQLSAPTQCTNSMHCTQSLNTVRLFPHPIYIRFSQNIWVDRVETLHYGDTCRRQRTQKSHGSFSECHS